MQKSRRPADIPDPDRPPLSREQLKIARWLKKLKFGQTIYELGPQTHQKKQGTATMGGVIFAVPALVAALGALPGAWLGTWISMLLYNDQA